MSKHLKMPDAMSRTKRDGKPPPSMRALFVLVTMAVLFGAAGTAAGIVNNLTTQGASKADIRATADLVRQVRELERESKASRDQHRTFNQADHNCLIALVLIATDPERDRTEPIIPPCRVSTVPPELQNKISPVPDPPNNNGETSNE